MVSVSKTRVIYGLCIQNKSDLWFMYPKQEIFMVSVSKTRDIYGFCIQNKRDLWFLYAKQE